MQSIEPESLSRLHEPSVGPLLMHQVCKINIEYNIIYCSKTNNVHGELNDRKHLATFVWINLCSW